MMISVEKLSAANRNVFGRGANSREHRIESLTAGRGARTGFLAMNLSKISRCRYADPYVFLYDLLAVTAVLKVIHLP